QHYSTRARAGGGGAQELARTTGQARQELGFQREVQGAARHHVYGAGTGWHAVEGARRGARIGLPPVAAGTSSSGAAQGAILDRDRRRAQGRFGAGPRVGARDLSIWALQV